MPLERLGKISLLSIFGPVAALTKKKLLVMGS